MCSDSFPGEQRAAAGRAQPEATSSGVSGAGAQSDLAWPALTTPGHAHGALERGRSRLN